MKFLMIWAGLLFGAPAALAAPVANGPDDLQLVIEETGAQGAQGTRTRFWLVDEDGARVVVVRAYEVRQGDAWIPQPLSDECRRSFGAQGDEIGRVRVVPEQARIDDLAPVCAPEPLFGAITDIASFALIAHSPEFRAGELRAVGESLPLEGFTATWTRPPALVRAELISVGGMIRRDPAAAPDEKRLVWNPGPMRLSLTRQAGPDRTMTLEGTETIELEVDIGPNGEILRGRSRDDRLDMTLHMPGIPPQGMPVTITRVLTLGPAE